MNVCVYVLTHDKLINQNFDVNLYKPLICGANSLSEHYNYLCDNTGDNISDLNKYYSEISGEYWVWKNSNAEIIGFCHYRRWFVKNLKFDKITEEDIIKNLKEYDIILPKKRSLIRTLYDMQKKSDEKTPDYDVMYEDYIKIEKVLEDYYPDYVGVYRDVMNGYEMYTNNMFICRRELANEYFKWLFDILDKLTHEIDLSKYDFRDSRVFGFISERLLTTFVLKNKLNVKEFNMMCLDKNPYIYLIMIFFERFIPPYKLLK